MEINENKKELYFEKVYDNIQNIGYHTTAVLEAENSTPFAYSTGIFENFKIPELFISGLGPNLSGELIEKYVEKYKFTKIPLNRKIKNLIDRFPVYLIKVNNLNLENYILTSIKFYENRDYKYLQLVFPDLNGNFPHELNYNYDQQIIGNLSF